MAHYDKMYVWGIQYDAHNVKHSRRQSINPIKRNYVRVTSKQTI